MPDRVVIRPASREDYDQWRPLCDGYNAFYGRAGSTALLAGITRTTWERFFDGYEPVHALVTDGAASCWASPISSSTGARRRSGRTAASKTCSPSGRRAARGSAGR